jgi:hypothetical protein
VCPTARFDISAILADSGPCGRIVETAGTTVEGTFVPAKPVTSGVRLLRRVSC